MHRQYLLCVCAGSMVAMLSHMHSYRSRALLGACAYNSTGRRYAPISEMRLITNIFTESVDSVCRDMTYTQYMPIQKNLSKSQKRYTYKPL